LLDAEILAEVYLDLIGARQAQLMLVEAGAAATGMHATVSSIRLRPDPLAPRLSTDEREAHAAFVATLGENAVWHEYLTRQPCDRAG
jgi:DNA polymerase-3 subunit epsilon